MGWKEDLNWGLEAFGVKIPDSLPLDHYSAMLADMPCRNTWSLVLGSSLMFYLAERGHNPKVKDVYDALVYCSSSISVGYSDIFPRTPAGKIIGSTLMTMGPAMASKTLDGPAMERRDAVQLEMLATLRQILQKLEANPTPAPQEQT